MKNKTLLTDFYEYTMGESYFKAGKKDEIAYFDVFFRTNPFKGGYLITGGLDNIIDYLKNFHFDESDIEYLRSTNKFSEEYLKYLKDLKFTGDVYAMEDGTPAFPNEPIITIKAPIIEAQLIETALLTNFNHGSLVTTAAKRITEAAGSDVDVMEFGARRARGESSSVEASKYAYIGGCSGTSNTLAGKKYDIPVLGTMAHSMIEEADSEYQAFLEYAKANPDNCVFLIDTYDTLESGLLNAIRVSRDYLEPNGYKMKGVRIDSGDLAYLSKETRKILDACGYEDCGICLSNGLNEYTITDLKQNGGKFTSLGTGDNIAAPKERVNGVYKLVAIEKDNKIIPKIKISEDTIKTINPSYKKVYRFYDKDTKKLKGDVITLADEEISKEKYTLVDPTDTWKKTELENYELKELQVPIFKNGKLVYELPSIEERKKYCEKEFETLYPRLKDVNNPHRYYVDLSNDLRMIKENILIETKNKTKEVKNEFKKLIKENNK